MLTFVHTGRIDDHYKFLNLYFLHKVMSRYETGQKIIINGILIFETIWNTFEAIFSKYPSMKEGVKSDLFYNSS